MLANEAGCTGDEAGCWHTPEVSRYQGCSRCTTCGYGLVARMGASPDKSETGRLGTFGGVFTPSVLTILGIILFLRLGDVVGEGGLRRALIVIALANTVSVLTSWSLAAIATNFKVKGGGDYYLISRTLGPQFGGAIGIALFLAQSISIAFYAIGFAEGVSAIVTIEWLPPRAIAALAIGPLFLLAWIGSDWATRFQYAIMAVLGLSLVVFVIGALQSFDSATLAGNWEPTGELPFWVLFALFFPAVTGFTQGVSMSGELKDPARSLPTGTFVAVGLSMVVYFGVAILFAGAAPGNDLKSFEGITDYNAMRRVAVWPAVITTGIFAATLSSSLASAPAHSQLCQKRTISGAALSATSAISGELIDELHGESTATSSAGTTIWA